MVHEFWCEGEKRGVEPRAIFAFESGRRLIRVQRRRDWGMKAATLVVGFSLLIAFVAIPF